MTSLSRLLRISFLVLLAFMAFRENSSGQLLDDRQITIASARDVKQRRQALIHYIWGAQGWPTAMMPSRVVTNVASPVRHLTNLARVDELRFDLATGLEGLAYHFVPEKPNRELVVVHHGHACTLDDDPSSADLGYGLQRTIQALLGEGYGVLGVFMPRQRPGDCGGSHGELFTLPVASGSPMRFFLEPVAVSLNYLKARSRADRFPKYGVFHMAGLSGGGWTTSVYAAIDPTIRCSFPIAGTIPLHLRSGGSIGDREQFEPSFYGIAGYPDLYVLGASGRGRKQVQILNQRDDCCFGESQHDARAAGRPYAEAMREYAHRVSAAVDQIGRGSFRLEIDATAPSHMISHHAIQDILLPELRRAR
jgi:hypothetical protein